MSKSHPSRSAKDIGLRVKKDILSMVGLNQGAGLKGDIE